MKSKTTFSALALVAIGLSSGTANATNTKDVGLNVGSMGVGPQIGMTIVPNKLDARLSTGFLNYSYSTTSNNLEYNGHLNLRNIALLGDWHPFYGLFRVTGGLIYNDNKFDLTGLPVAGSTYTLNGVSYTAQSGDQANAKVGFKKFAPYIGIGWGNNDNTPGLHFTTDIGMMYQGSPSATVKITTANPADQALADSYANQAQSKLNADLNNFKWYPVVQAGAVYRF